MPAFAEAAWTSRCTPSLAIARSTGKPPELCGGGAFDSVGTSYCAPVSTVSTVLTARPALASRRPGPSLFRRDDDDGHGGPVPNCVNGAAVNDVPQEPMPVRRHRDQVHALGCRGGEDLIRRAAEPEPCTDGQSSFCAKARSAVLEIFPILPHLLGASEVELVEISRNPSVGDMQEQ